MDLRWATTRLPHTSAVRHRFVWRFLLVLVRRRRKGGGSAAAIGAGGAFFFPVVWRLLLLRLRGGVFRFLFPPPTPDHGGWVSGRRHGHSCDTTAPSSFWVKEHHVGVGSGGIAVRGGGGGRGEKARAPLRGGGRGEKTTVGLWRGWRREERGGGGRHHVRRRRRITRLGSRGGGGGGPPCRGRGRSTTRDGRGGGWGGGTPRPTGAVRRRSAPRRRGRKRWIGQLSAKSPTARSLGSCAFRSPLLPQRHRWGGDEAVLLLPPSAS